MNRRVVTIVCLVALAMLGVGSAFAATAGGGDLQGLIDATSAGETLVLAPGVYTGGVTIEHPIRIEGSPGVVIDAGGEGTAIEIDAADVSIDGVLIRNTGTSLDRENAGISANAPRVSITNNVFENVLFGVFLRSADDSVVRNNIIGAKDVDHARRGDGIRLWESPRTVVSSNVVRDGRDVVLWFSDDLIVTDNVVESGRYGLHFMYSDRAEVRGNRLAGNSVGAFLMYSRDLVLTDNIVSDNQGPSGYGVGLKDMDGVSASGNRFIGNRVGLYLDNSPWSVDVWQEFTGNLFAYNDVGVTFLPSVRRNAFSENAFVDNGEQVALKGGGVLAGNEWSIDGVGNYWSDFAGYDADGNGVGDIEYRLDELYSSLADANPDLRFFDETPAARALDMAGQMFPVLRPAAKVVDPAPLVNMPHFESVVAGGNGSGLAVGSLVMLSLAAVVIVLGRPRRSRSAVFT